MKKIFVLAVVVFSLLPVGLFANPNQTGQAPPTSQAPQAPPTITGKVLETMNSGGYTYVRLGMNKEKIWVAVPEMKAAVGKEMTFYTGVVMMNYESKTLKRKFDRIIFSAGPAKAGTVSGGMTPGSHGQTGQAGQAGQIGKPAATVKVKVAKAVGPGAYTVAELYKNKASLQKKSVTVRGKVTKVSSGIMGKTWLHIQDGTGTASKGDHDLVVTTSAIPSEGDVVTVKGKLAVNRDFGMGYKYDLIIEDATINK